MRVLRTKWRIRYCKNRVLTIVILHSSQVSGDLRVPDHGNSNSWGQNFQSIKIHSYYIRCKIKLATVAQEYSDKPRSNQKHQRILRDASIFNKVSLNQAIKATLSGEEFLQSIDRPDWSRMLRPINRRGGFYCRLFQSFPRNTGHWSKDFWYFPYTKSCTTWNLPILWNMRSA